MSNFSAKIELSAGNKTRSIFQSIETDNKFYHENPGKSKFSFNEKIEILIEADEISHLRANLNSTLRLVQTSNDSLESVKI